MPRIPGKHSNNWGGARPNSGRKMGRIDKYCRAVLKDAYESGESPFQYLMSVMRDEDEDKKIRMAAANVLLPFTMPRLAQVDMNVSSETANLTLEEKIALAASLRGRILEHNPDAAVPALPINGEVVASD